MRYCQLANSGLCKVIATHFKTKTKWKSLFPKGFNSSPFLLTALKVLENVFALCLPYRSEAQFPIAVLCVSDTWASHMPFSLILWQLSLDFNLVKDHCLVQKQFIRRVFIKSNGFTEYGKDVKWKQVEIIVLVFSLLPPLFPGRGGTGKRKFLSTRKWYGTGTSPICWSLWSQRPCQSQPLVHLVSWQLAPESTSTRPLQILKVITIYTSYCHPNSDTYLI